MSKAFLDNFVPLNTAIITVSDTRDEKTDTSGALLKELLEKDGHKVVTKIIVKDDIEELQKVVKSLCTAEVEVIITTGGTGFTKRDNTKEAIYPMLTKTIDGFGEIFRLISYGEIKTAAMQSNAFAGFINKHLIFCVPGSTGACRTAYESILKYQLNSTTKPCNFAALIKLNYN